jgi:tetratricopeptide (TPR) repeat protein
MAIPPKSPGNGCATPWPTSPLDAVVASIRTLLRSTRSRTISGEITVRDKQLWLALRLDGQKFYESGKGVDPEKPDALFLAAAPEVLKKIRPYFVAVDMRHKDPDRALIFIDEMIAELPASDEYVPWFYSQQGLIYLNRKDFAAATLSFQTALRMTHGNLMPAHANLALVYKAQNLDDKAAEEYKIALKLAPEFPVVHFGYGILLAKQHKEAEAIAELRRAIALRPDYPEARRELDKLLPPEASTGTVPQK